jgi:hypothetical protein
VLGHRSGTRARTHIRRAGATGFSAAGGHPDFLALLIAVIVAAVGVTASVVLSRSDDGGRRTED